VWSGRSYKTTDFDDADEVNKALSAANTALYGVVHAVIVALGCSPGLGFVHARNERSFVYDIADLYKVDITIPLAFDLVAQQVADVSVAARRGIRDRMKDGKFLQRCVHDVRELLLVEEAQDSLDDTGAEGAEFGDVVAEGTEVEDLTTKLWSGASGYVASGKNYA
jgi:CRISPR-associated protein Cas1